MAVLFVWTLYMITVIVCVKGSVPEGHCGSHTTPASCLKHQVRTEQPCSWSTVERKCQDTRQILSVTNATADQSGNEVNTGYDPFLAYNYTLMCAIAYSSNPKACQSRIMPDSDFVLQQSITSNCRSLPLFHKETCYAYTAVSAKRKMILLAFRGTEFPNKGPQIIDEIISVLWTPKQPFMTGGDVQYYFKNAHDKLSPCIENAIKNLTTKYTDYQVTITGHSLGAALASLTAASLVYKGVIDGDRLTVYQFGEPRVGNGQYATNFDKLVKNSWRVVHNRDVVSHLPTCNWITGCSVSSGGPYHTKTEVFYPAIDMDPTSKYKICARNEDKTCSDGLVTKNWCTTDVDDCIRYHKTYFRIPVGTYCDGSVSDGSPMGEHSLTDKCTTRNF